MLYIMRHGKTDWNAMRKLQGRTDIPLNEEGRQMAEHARTEYADIHFDICYCSPLIRAKETAEIVLKGRNIPIITDDRLKEMSFGSYEGTANCITTPGCPIKNLFLDPANYKDVLIVGHGAMNSSIICQVKGIPLSEFWSAGIENCKLKRIL